MGYHHRTARPAALTSEPAATPRLWPVLRSARIAHAGAVARAHLAATGGGGRRVGPGNDAGRRPRTARSCRPPAPPDPHPAASSSQRSSRSLHVPLQLWCPAATNFRVETPAAGVSARGLHAKVFCRKRLRVSRASMVTRKHLLALALGAASGAEAFAPTALRLPATTAGCVQRTRRCVVHAHVNRAAAPLSRRHRCRPHTCGPYPAHLTASTSRVPVPTSGMMQACMCAATGPGPLHVGRGDTFAPPAPQRYVSCI